MVEQHVQNFQTELETRVPAAIEWGTQVAFGFLGLMFAVTLIMVVIRKYTSN